MCFVAILQPIFIIVFYAMSIGLDIAEHSTLTWHSGVAIPVISLTIIWLSTLKQRDWKYYSPFISARYSNKLWLFSYFVLLGSFALNW